MTTRQSRSHVFHFFLNREYVSIARAEGAYLYDDQGKRYLDASGGPILCSLGHGLAEMADVLGDQAPDPGLCAPRGFHLPSP